MQTDKALWQAINAYELDDADAAFPFSHRLARDAGWTLDYTSRAIAEYKRFIYLICTSGLMQTPSDQVDTVWHLHLTYTQDYWDRFCGETLKRKIHHCPTRGGPVDADTFLTCYQRTLAHYDCEFGPPPADIWPDSQARFERPERPPVPNPRTHIILPKRQVFLCLIAATCLGLAACQAAPMVDTLRHLGRKQWLMVAIVALVGWVFVISILQRTGVLKPTPGKPGGGDGGCGSGCGATFDGGGSDGGGDGGSGCGSGCGGGCGGGD